MPQERRKRRTVSETETHRVVTVRGRSMRAYCAECGRHVEMCTVDQAAEALGISVAALCERSSNSGGHSVVEGGVRWVCASWLSRGRL